MFISNIVKLALKIFKAEGGVYLIPLFPILFLEGYRSLDRLVTIQIMKIPLFDSVDYIRLYQVHIEYCINFHNPGQDIKVVLRSHFLAFKEGQDLIL